MNNEEQKAIKGLLLDLAESLHELVDEIRGIRGFFDYTRQLQRKLLRVYLPISMVTILLFVGTLTVALFLSRP